MLNFTSWWTRQGEPMPQTPHPGHSPHPLGPHPLHHRPMPLPCPWSSAPALLPHLRRESERESKVHKLLPSEVSITVEAPGPPSAVQHWWGPTQPCQNSLPPAFTLAAPSLHKEVFPTFLHWCVLCRALLSSLSSAAVRRLRGGILATFVQNLGE